MPSFGSGDMAHSHNDTRLATVSSDNKPTRRRRLPLSCGECREKKLSCDRKLPCQRCVRSGRSHQCSYETATAQPRVMTTTSAEQSQTQRHSDEIRDLRAQVAHLKELLSKNSPHPEDDGEVETSGAALQRETREVDQNLDAAPGAKPAYPSDPRDRNPQGYYSQHSLIQLLTEVPQLFPFIRETVHEWLRPVGVDLKKFKPISEEYKGEILLREENASLDKLLPPQEDLDTLVAYYLDHIAPVYRILHVPTFEREYANFCASTQARSSVMTALILSIVAISACASGSTNDDTSVASRYRAMPGRWVSACDTWLKEQSSKHRKLVHYQVSCLVYLAKRVNMIRRKRYWMETGSLIQRAIIDGLHSDPSSANDSPYVREMKRRIWAVLRELDLQNTFENGLPTLLHNIQSNAAAPTDINDAEFDETSIDMPASEQGSGESYRSLSARSWALRLEVSRRLFNPGISQPLSYDDVLRLTHELTQVLQAVPIEDSGPVASAQGPRMVILSHACLRFQLMECILAVHRPYLKRCQSVFWMSENVCHQISRDILLLNRRLASLGIHGLALLREDLLLASLNITHLTVLQPPNSTGIIVSNSDSTIELLEQCLPTMEERYLRCYPGEPWCFITMYACIMLMKMHVGKENWQTAKFLCAQRFLALYYKHTGIQPMPQSSLGQLPKLSPNECQSTPNTITEPTSEWLLSSCVDVGANAFGLDMDVDSVWESWGLAWPTMPVKSMT